MVVHLLSKKKQTINWYYEKKKKLKSFQYVTMSHVTTRTYLHQTWLASRKWSTIKIFYPYQSIGCACQMKLLVSHKIFSMGRMPKQDLSDKQLYWCIFHAIFSFLDGRWVWWEVKKIHFRYAFSTRTIQPSSVWFALKSCTRGFNLLWNK